jgi:DNA polymerase III gamma/tau subunit
VSKPIAEPQAPRKVCPDILRWQPSRWDLFLANHCIIKHFKRLLRKCRRILDHGSKEDFSRLSFLLFGLSRSGKTALVKFLIRCVTCKKLDGETLTPCDGSCDTCKHQPELFGLEGIESYFQVEDRQVPVHFALVDCTMIHTPEQLREKLVALASYHGLRIYYFDEVHRLIKRGMDEMLLKAVEERNYLWLFSTAKPGGLEDMFQNRLLKLKTQLPSHEALATWLADRCDEWGITWEPEAIDRVVEKSNLIVGTALHALALASLDPDEGLTIDLVENDWVVKLDE